MFKRTKLSEQKRVPSVAKPILSILSKLKRTGLYPAFHVLDSAGTEPTAIIDDKTKLVFCANNYLGLSLEESISKAAIRAIKKHGMGPGGSRVLCGNIRETVDLEKKLAKFLGKSDSLTFPTGYMANLAIFPALMDPLFGKMPFAKESGVILSDEYNHTSIIEGCRATKARKVIFRHNDVADIEEKLRLNRGVHGNRMLVTEGVYSMQAEITPLDTIVPLAHKYGYMVMVDDAHGIGILGQHGGGAAEHFGLSEEIDIIMGSFDKAFGSIGGFLASSGELTDYLRVSARPSMFSSAFPAYAAAGMTRAIEVVERGEKLRRAAIGNANETADLLRAKGFEVLSNKLLSVVAVLIGNDKRGLEFEKRIFEEGVFSPVIRWPAVPQNESRLRLAFTASHTKQHSKELIRILTKVGRELRIIR